ncbi:DUF305 domain-containing protein [Moraxella boevrei]|uniref:CopM family metallochaperone n=1 Tax=Faucicola boevrei TaxID=346665 RepID=UPI0037357475
MLAFLSLRCDHLAIYPPSVAFWRVFVLANLVLLSACQPPEKTTEQRAEINIEQSSLPINSTTNLGQPTENFITSASQTITFDDVEDVHDEIDDDMGASHDDINDDTLNIEEIRTIRTTNTPKSHLDTMLQHYAMNQFLPNGEHSEDFQQAYLASIYTMRYAKSQNVDNPKNPDVVFVQNMIRHHQSGIDMAEIELKYGEDASLQRLARDMITAQQNEIWLMQHWLKEENHHTKSQTKLHPKTADIQQEFTDSINQMHEQMLAGAVGNDADMAFIQTMLPHHKGALAMAQVQLKYGTDPKMRNLADNIIMNQIAEIQVMENWLKEHR